MEYYDAPYHKIYDTHYQATKHKPDRWDVVAKVCAGGDKVGYMIIPAQDYKRWKNEK